MSAKPSLTPAEKQRSLPDDPDRRVVSVPLRALALLRRDLFDADEVSRIDAIAQRVAEVDLYVVAIGEFKRGKSTLLNGLVGREVLPVGVIPLTAVVTVLRCGRSRGLATHENGRILEIEPERLADYVTEEGNPGNRQHLVRVEVASPDFLLPAHAVLVDTPGLGSVYESGTDHALEFLPQVDVALVVLSVDQPLTEAERDLAVRLRDHGAEVFFVLNKADYLSPAEVETARRFVADRLRSSGFHGASVLAVSAKLAGRGGGDEGMLRLRRELTTLLQTRHEAIHQGQAARRTAVLLDELETGCAVRREIARGGQAELDRALEELGESRDRIRELADEQDAVFSERIARAERRLGDEMAAFRQSLEQILLADVESLADAPGLDEAQVDECMATTIEQLLADELPRQSRALEDALRAACGRLIEEIDRLSVSLAESASAILGTSIPQPQASSQEHVTPTVNVKLRDDPVGLEMLAAALRAPLSRGIRRRLFLKRSRQRAGELADRHAGRARSELASALRAEARKAGKDAHGQLDSLTRSIDRAVERGLAQRRLAAAEADDALSRTEAALHGIRAARKVLARGEVTRR